MVFIALLAAIFRSGQGLMHRFVLDRIVAGHYVWYAGVFNLLSAAFFIPLFLIEFSFPMQLFPWLLASLSASLWIAIALVSFKSYVHTEIALRTPISETRILWVLLFSWLVLSETVTLGKLLGIALMMTAFFILSCEKGRFMRLREIGVRLTLLSAFLAALVSIVDKAALAYWSPGVYGFVQYLIPGIAIAALGRYQRAKRTKLATKRNVAYVLLGALMGMLFYYFELLALSSAEVSVVVPIFRLSTIFTVLGGIVLLKERKDIGKRLLAAGFAFLATLFIAGVL